QLLDNQVFVQTLSGNVEAIDADTGVTLWNVRVGTPYKITHRVAANKESVFAVRSGVLYDIDRKSGQVRWEFRLPGAPSAAPAADEERIFLALGTGRFYAFLLPEAVEKEEKKLAAAAVAADKSEPTKTEKDRETYSSFGVRGSSVGTVGSQSSATEARQSEVKGPQPVPLFEYVPDTRIERAPLLTDDRVVLAGSDGTFV